MSGLPDVESKNIIGLLPTKLAEVWSDNRTNPKDAKHNICRKQIRSFSTTIECDNTRSALL